VIEFNPSKSAVPAANDDRKLWVAPAVSTMRAGETESGGNPANLEGQFGTGS
jgi:hypothetical protein